MSAKSLTDRIVHSFEEWVRYQNAMMDEPRWGPFQVVREETPENWNREQINPMPAARSRTMSGAAHPPLGCITEDAHEDVVRRFHIEPEIEAQKRFLEENRKRLAQDRADWWSGNSGR